MKSIIKVGDVDGRIWYVSGEGGALTEHRAQAKVFDSFAAANAVAGRLADGEDELPEQHQHVDYLQVQAVS